MTPTELARLLGLSFQLLVLLGLLAASLTLVRQFTEKRTVASMNRQHGKLVGQRALVVSDLRAGRVGQIRPLDPDPAKLKSDRESQTFPAVSDQLISRGRVVRVTGGDSEGYLVRPIEKER